MGKGKQKEIVVADFDEQWGKWLEQIHNDLKRVADCLDRIHSEGILAYPSMKERVWDRVEARR